MADDVVVAVPASASQGRALSGWQILLITLGVVSIVVLLVLGWHRYAKKWARAKTHAWRHRFDKRSVVNPQPPIVDEEIVDRRLERVQQLEEARRVTSPREFDRVPSPVSPIDRYSFSNHPVGYIRWMLYGVEICCASRPRAVHQA